MKINFAEEISRCFEKQYQKDSKDYMDFVFGMKGNINKQVRLYEQMLDDFDFMTNLIIKLMEVKNGKNKNKRYI